MKYSRFLSDLNIRYDLLRDLSPKQITRLMNIVRVESAIRTFERLRKEHSEASVYFVSGGIEKALEKELNELRGGCVTAEALFIDMLAKSVQKKTWLDDEATLKVLRGSG